MATILITRPLPEAVIDAARRLGDVTVRRDTAPMSLDDARAALLGYDVILPSIGDDFGAATFAGIEHPRARILANFGVGYNHIDISACSAKGVAVSNTPDTVTDATADIAVTLILMSCRRAGEGERMLRAGKWKGWHPVQMMGTHVTGKTVGLIGMGRIGQAIAKRCHFGFGMEVVYANRSPKEVDFPATQLGSISEVAAHADIVVAAVPGGAETHHLLGQDLFSAMKETAHFINISRGDVVDESALILALQDKQIAGAGLDVYEFEPKVPDALMQMENVTLLPHLGTAALEVRTAMGMMAVDNIRAFLASEALPNPV